MVSPSTDKSAARESLRPPPPGDLIALGVAVIFISFSGPLIAATAAPVLAIAFWRCFIGSGLTGIWVLVRERRQLAALGKREIKLIVFAGILLGLHFVTWIPSLAFTSVAASTALVATQPIWAAFIARARGILIPRAAWVGIFIALAGVIFLTGVDVQMDTRHLIGDLLALAGAVFAAAYVSVAEQVRQSVSTGTMTFIVYGVSAITVLPLVAIFQQELFGFSAQAWIYILAITLGAQLLGHTLINKVLANSSATFVSMAILFEMPGAAIVAAIWLGQAPPVAIYPAAALILLGIVIVIKASSRSKQPLESPPV